MHHLIVDGQEFEVVDETARPQIVNFTMSNNVISCDTAIADIATDDSKFVFGIFVFSKFFLMRKEPNRVIFANINGENISLIVGTRSYVSTMGEYVDSWAQSVYRLITLQAFDAKQNALVMVDNTDVAGAVSFGASYGFKYKFGSISSLTWLHPSEEVDHSKTEKYAIFFTSGSTATTVTVPAEVTMPAGQTFEANKTYEIIVDEYGYATVNSWSV